MRRLKNNTAKSLSIFVFAVVLFFYAHIHFNDQIDQFWKNLFKWKLEEDSMKQLPTIIHIALVSCAKLNFQQIREPERSIDQTITMMKSAVLLSTSTLHFHIFTEEDMKITFKSELETWPKKIRDRITFSLYEVNYEPFIHGPQQAEWKRWYKPCGSYRLFIPMLLQNVADAVIYCDSDVIFVKPVEQLWLHLHRFDARQVIAVAPTSGHALGGSPSNEYMIRGSGELEGGFFQINSGILLMDIKRMLTADWRLFHHQELSDTEEGETMKYGSDLLLRYWYVYREVAEHDQKLLNIMFHYNPDLLLRLPCKWNFKNNFCHDDENTCPDAEEDGAGAVHGITSAFFGDVNPTFRALYEAFLEYDLEQDRPASILDRYLAQLHEDAVDTYCWKKSHVITLPLTEHINQIQPHR